MAANGKVRAWQSNGYMSSDWIVADTNDFNNDGNADILWKNALTGDVIEWLMDGKGNFITKFIDTVSPDWEIASTGDYNSDFVADILWRNSSTGELGEWLMNKDGTIGSWKSLGYVSSDWKVVT